jgi:two-component system sensor histidine kinase KdpD
VRDDDDHRPDPDQLLAMVQREENREHRGRLRIFLGMAPGVGKTYSMLEAARLKKSEGVDLLLGVVETHGRAETEALQYGLDVLPRQVIDYHGHELTEFDLDAVLARRPELLLVDELAHTNAPGCRHDKRWQDVEEILDNGIDVWSTLNVQHLESLGDVVAQITGVKVQETVPDTVLERADSVVLVDLPPDDLRQRLKEGKVYIPQQAEWAAKNFFRQGNLMALRELALRATAQRANTEVLVYRHGRSIQTTWPTSERIMVCVGPAPSSAKLVRAAKRLATGLRAPWLALSIQTASMPQKARDSALRHLQRAEELGAETYVLTGQSVASETVAFARKQNVTKIVVGKPTRRGLKDYILGSPVDQIILLSEEIDVYVIRGDAGEPSEKPAVRQPPSAVAWQQYLSALAVMAAATALSFVMYPYFEVANLIMVYLVGVMGVAVWLGRGPSIMASAVSVVAFDFCFVPPRFDFAVSDVHYLVTFGVMFLVAVVMSSMASKIKRQADSAGTLERQSSTLALLSRELMATRGLDNLLGVASRHLADVFEHHAYFLLPDPSGRLITRSRPPGASALHGKDLGVAQWVLANGKQAGQGTQTLPNTDMVFMPLKGTGGVVGVVGLKAGLPQAELSLRLPDRQRLLEAFINQIAMALEVDRLEEAAKTTLLEIESEKLKSTLLSAVTHDFQTPLTAMAGSAESIMLMGESGGFDKIRSLAENIHEEATRLSRLVANLLRIARLDSGHFKPNLQPIPLEEVVGAALIRTETLLAGHAVQVDLPSDLPVAMVDDVLMEQLLVNLLENSAKYSPQGAPVKLSAGVRGGRLQLEVFDQGPGIPPDDLESVFEPFFRVNRENQPEGYGLGLAICRSIAKAHGGSIHAENMGHGGLRFIVTLPLPGEQKKNAGYPAKNPDN